MPKRPFVYIVSNRRNGTLYIGVTSDLPKRVWQHKNGVLGGFSQKYRCSRLVWFEPHVTMEAAILREKQMKRWNRAWKLRLIGEKNPEWIDLYDEICS